MHTSLPKFPDQTTSVSALSLRNLPKQIHIHYILRELDLTTRVNNKLRIRRFAQINSNIPKFALELVPSYPSKSPLRSIVSLVSAGILDQNLNEKFLSFIRLLLELLLRACVDSISSVY